MSNVQVIQLFLYHPNDELAQRIVDQDMFLNYCKEIQNMLIMIDFNDGKQKPCIASIIIAIKPVNELRIWFDVNKGLLTQEAKDQIRDIVTSLPTPQVKHGPVAVAFALCILKARGDIEELPIPIEWKEKAKYYKDSVSIDTLLEDVWNL